MQILIHIKQDKKLKFIKELLNSFSFIEIIAVDESKDEKKVKAGIIPPKKAKGNPVALFGKWKDLEIDPIQHRRDSWRRA